MIYYLLISVKLNHAASYRYYFRFLTVIFLVRAYFSFSRTVFSAMLDTLLCLFVLYFLCAICISRASFFSEFFGVSAREARTNLFWDACTGCAPYLVYCTGIASNSYTPPSIRCSLGWALSSLVVCFVLFVRFSWLYRFN